MQMNRMEHDLWVRAVNELCRACPFTACPGQTKCVRLAERIVEMKERVLLACGACAAAAALLAVLGVIF
jgi:hypothetical protein